MTETKFQQKIRERREREAAIKAAEDSARKNHPAAQAVPQVDEDLIPEDPYSRSDDDKEMDRVIDSIDVLDAYRRWCGKMTPKVATGQRESIMVSCPTPGHTDKTPSAWINLDKQTWFCGGCQIGGDAHDIAAYHFGYSVPGYKSGATFHELRRDMAKDMGFTITKLAGGVTQITPPADDEDEKPEPASEAVENDDPVASVYTMLAEEPEFEDFDVELNWREILPNTDTFLDEYMKATVIDDVPEEYHFWNGLIALAFALGRDVRLFDDLPVVGNLFVCTLGRSGSGKSKSEKHLAKLLDMALPYDDADPNSKGVRKLSTPGSAENLIYQFQKPIVDPTNPKVVAYNAPVRGLILFSELSALTSRTARSGSALAPTLMEFYDNNRVISTSSMTTGKKEAFEPFACASTTTQPKALKTLLTNADASSGFLNRWVFVPGKPKKRVAIGGAIVDMTPAVAPLQAIAGWAGAFHPNELMLWSEEAADLYTDFFYERITPDKHNDESEMLVRIDLLVKKLCLLFTANLKLKMVPAEAVQQAIACYDYLIRAYGIPAAQVGNSITYEVEQVVLERIKRAQKENGKGPTVNEVARALKGRKWPNDWIKKAFDSHVALGNIEQQASAKGSAGRPTVRFKYVGS